MKIETPVLELDDYEEDYKVGHDTWLCHEWIEEYFGILPPKISLEFSDAPSKEAVSILLRAHEDGQVVWAPASRGYADREIYNMLDRWLLGKLPVRRRYRRYYVTVWIYEVSQRKNTSD